ncbi:hypothetical protein D3C72_2268390 [compost metagenome]
MDLCPDLLFGLQRHDHELAMFGRVEDASEIVIVDRETFDVLHKAFHSDSSWFTFMPCSSTLIRRLGLYVSW